MTLKMSVLLQYTTLKLASPGGNIYSAHNQWTMLCVCLNRENPMLLVKLQMEVSRTQQQKKASWSVKRLKGFKCSAEVLKIMRIAL